MDGIFTRIANVFRIFIVITFCVIAKIIYVQFISPSEISADDIAHRTETIEANRGDILSCDGRPLATSIPYYQVRMDCTVSNQDTFSKYIDVLAKELANFYKNKSAAAYSKELKKARKDGKRYVKIGNRLVDYSELEQIKKFPILKLGANRGGLITEQKYRRNNPYGRLAYRTIGFINTEGVGVGIEGSCDYYLKGTPGHQVVQRMLGGEWIPVNGEESVMPQDGYDIQTTIDIEIQEVAEKALKEQLMKSDNNIEGATALVMEVETGAIRAIANMKKDGKGGFDESYNYAIGEATEPGSVFKLVTLVSLLEDGYVTLDTPVDAGAGKWTVGGHTYSDTHPIGLVTVEKAFEQSSNVAFAKLAYEHYGNNQQAYADRVQSMKIGERFNLDIQGEARATIYTPSDEAMWSKTSLTSMAIGYAALVTPLHTLTFYNAIANDGKMMKPYFIENYQSNGEIVKEFEPQEISGAICSKKTAESAQRALRSVVEKGTGRIYVNSKDFPISGKTGTSRIAFGGKEGYERNGYRRYQASFCGFYPSDNPKYSTIVVIYSGPTRGNFYGATQAGPIFKKIAEYIYTTSPDWERTLDGKEKATGVPQISIGKTEMQQTILAELDINGKNQLEKFAPQGWMEIRRDSTKIFPRKYSVITDSLVNVVNMGVKDAVYILENQGFKVNFKGRGRVIAQTPAAGSKVAANSVINLELSNNGTN